MKNPSRSILVVEHDVPFAEKVQKPLKNAGFNVEIISDGKMALKRLEETSFDLIILDIVLPLKDGFQVLATLKKRKNTTPVVVLTHLSHTDDIEFAQHLGAHDFLSKSKITPELATEYVIEMFS